MKQSKLKSADGLVLGPDIPKRPIHWSLAFIKECCQLHPSHKSSVQLVRSLVVSVISLVFDFTLMVFLKEVVGLHYLWAATLGFTAGVIVNYVLSISWVFANHKLSSRHAEFLIFVVICGIGLLLNLAIIAGLVQILHFDYRWAKVVSTILVFFWNFLARKKILY